MEVKRTKGVSAFKYASDIWLGFNFGARPLIADTRAASDSIVAFLEREDAEKLRCTSGADYSWLSSSSSEANSAGLNGAYLHWRAQFAHSVSFRYFAGYSLLVNNETDYNLWDHLGLNWESLPGIAWELVPLSWVLDYFTNLGAIFDDMFWSLPGACTYAGYTRQYSCVATVERHYHPYTKDYVLTSCRSKPTIVDKFEFRRVPLSTSSLSDLSFRFKTTDEIGFMAVSKLLNLTSVLIQRAL